MLIRSEVKQTVGMGIAFVAAVLLTTPSFLFSAQIPRLIEVEAQHRNDAVVITRVTLGGADVQSGLVSSATEVQSVTPVVADNDWLQTTTVYLLNRTNKTIAYGQIVLAFPETGDGRSPQSPMRVYNVTLGRLPASVAISGSTGKPLAQPVGAQPLAFQPGTLMQVNLGKYIDQGVASMTKCLIRRSSFVFDDGMKWDGIAYSTPDPDRPGHFKPTEPRYFPGRPVWPPQPAQ